MLPPAFGYSSSSSADPDMDWIGSRMGDLFDPLAAAEMAVRKTLQVSTVSQRWIAQLHSCVQEQPSMENGVV